MRPFRPECAAVQSQQLSSTAPFLFLRYVLQYVGGRLVNQALRKTGASDELPALLKQLADLRADSTRQERERNRYKLIVDNPTSNGAAQP